jgi:hypothetical protein
MQTEKVQEIVGRVGRVAVGADHVMARFWMGPKPGVRPAEPPCGGWPVGAEDAAVSPAEVVCCDCRGAALVRATAARCLPDGSG